MPVLDGKPCYRRTVLKEERLYENFFCCNFIAKNSNYFTNDIFFIKIQKNEEVNVNVKKLARNEMSNTCCKN